MPTAVVPMTEPAPTLTSKSPGQWVLRGNNTIAGGPLAERDVTEPALTVGSRADLWVFDRPATTVCGDPRLGFPGHHDKEHRSMSAEDGAVKITLGEALVLQSFPADYPLQGSRTKKIEQVGNAVPPLLANAVLATLTATSPTDQPFDPADGSVLADSAE